MKQIVKQASFSILEKSAGPSLHKVLTALEKRITRAPHLADRTTNQAINIKSLAMDNANKA